MKNTDNTKNTNNTITNDTNTNNTNYENNTISIWSFHLLWKNVFLVAPSINSFNQISGTRFEVGIKFQVGTSFEVVVNLEVSAHFKVPYFKTLMLLQVLKLVPRFEVGPHWGWFYSFKVANMFKVSMYTLWGLYKLLS